MNQELPWNTWGNFGINLALGNTLDKEIVAENYLYLPDYFSGQPGGLTFVTHVG